MSEASPSQTNEEIPSVSVREKNGDHRSPSRVGLYASVIVVWLVLLVGRVVKESSSELSQGEVAQRAGNITEAIRHFRRAAHWYLPFNPYVKRAYEKLEIIAIQSESQGRAEHAFLAWRAIRASALGTRWLITPEKVRLQRANNHLAILMANLPQPPEDQQRDRRDIQQEHLTLLQEDKSPQPTWVLILSIGLCMWLPATFFTARYGFDEEDRPIWRRLAITVGVWILGFALFLMGVANA